MEYEASREKGILYSCCGERATRTEIIKNSPAFILRRKETRIIQKPLELCQDARRRGEQS
jgi:hypothetical protein